MPPDLNVIDIGSGGWPCVPHAIQVELDSSNFKIYTSGQDRPPIQWKGDGTNLPFKDDVVDVVYSSHLIEDIAPERTNLVLREWNRVLKRGGHMIIMHPDRDIWNWCIRNKGQPPNCAHKAERKPGELADLAKWMGMTVISEAHTNLWEHDYNILSIYRKP